jgi:hypothetical protein
MADQDTPTVSDDTNVRLFRGKQTVREMQRANHDEILRRLQAIEQRLDAIERSL